VLTPYPHQEQALAGIDAALAAGFNRPAVVKATGLGKAVEAATWIARQHAANPRGRTLALVHRDELAQQLRNKIHSQAPHLRPGIVMGTQNDYDRPVVIASTQTLGRRDKNGRNRRRESIHSVARIVYDECHHAAAPTARETLDYFGAFGGVPTIGWTATMSREDKRGLGEVWQTIVQRPGPKGGVWDTEWGVRNGYLADPRGIRVTVPALDLSGVHIRRGDLDQDETATAMQDANTGGAIIRYIHDILTPQYGPRRGTVFAPNTQTTVEWTDEMNAAGIPTGFILGTTPMDERRRLYEAFRIGKLSWLINNMVLTEGWDAPWCDALIIARLTKSAALYQQMLGRGLRKFAGKQDCVVGDVCGVTEIHGLASLQDLSMDRLVKPRDGQSLLEALDEFEELSDDDHAMLDEIGWAPDRHPVHKVVGTEIDLFGKSRSVWLQTRAGTWFVPAADQLFFLWPQPDGLFTLGRTPKERAEPAIGIQADLDLEIGMALAEQHALAYAPAEAGKDAPWRQTGPVRPGQKRDLERYGLGVSRRMTAADAYDQICTAMATVRLDVQ
jgi:superfamily II DNA or RNA helicase